MNCAIRILPLLAAIVLATVAQARETKFIAHGWDCQSAHPDDVLASAAEFDKTPLDGVSLSIRFTNEALGVVCSYKTMISDPAWQWNDLEGYVPTLREIVKHRSLRESLLSAFRCPKKRLDWRDDAAWANFANNMRLLARLAREGNVKGLMIDPEDYPKSKQFYLQEGDLPYDETVAFARRRGREIFSAVFEEKPDVVILAFWLLATDKHVYNSHDPRAAMRECGCLFPAFMDGLMDVLPPTALLVDGNEGTYRCEAPYRDHYVDACQQRRNALDLLSPENRDKYRVQHRVGCGFFLDGYWYDSSNKWYFPPFNGTRADRLGLNLADAAQAADYVWLDGEWRTYVKWTKARTKGHHLGDHFLVRETWEEIMPGFWNEIRAAKDPCGCPYGTRKRLHVEKAQTVKGARSFRIGNVKYGEIYEVVGKPLTDLAFLRVDWKKEKGEKWAGRANSVQVVGGRAVFRVPQGVDTFAVIYNASRCKDGTASFTEVVANRLEVLSKEERTLTVAADELHKYWLQITGDQKVIPVRLAVDPAVSKSGNDAYAIKTVDGTACITGSNARSVLYGVYDLLERRGGCGWFWDGDRVPKLKKIDVSGLDVREESKFEYRGLRYFAHRGLTRFQAEHWGFEDWKREIDWCVKNRLNLFMLRIGQDDVFQKAYPAVCAYPDASKPLPGQHDIYNNRSLFWPLEFRGELRKKVMDYAFARGMMAPEDFGTMTHWYSRTPQDFLDKMKPEFLPQSSGGYAEKSGLVWDIRKKKWMDAYWKLTDASIMAYGKPDILHTIGVAERKMSDDPKENRQRKIDWTNMLLEGAKTRYPGCRRILAGWDLYCMKEASEVKAFLRHIPEDVVIWDYEADAYDRTNFTEWDLVGKRPYTFGVFTAYEAGLDMRTDYDLLAARQKLIADDPMCKGYIFWPESSHTDSLGIEWFARNAWRADRPEIRPIIGDYCRRRYGSEAGQMERLWLDTLPISTNMQSRWNKNALLTVLREFGEGLVKPERRADWPAAKPDTHFAAIAGVVESLKKLDWDKDEFLRRDMVDIARVWADRLAVESENRMTLAYLRWLDGDDSAKNDVVREGSVVRARLKALADILATHTDFSICDTYDRLCAVHPVTLPTFSSVLVDNAANYYCASHQAELAVHCYIPAFDAYLDLLKSRMLKNDRTPPERHCLEAYRKRAMAMSFEELRGRPDRSRAAFNRALDQLARAAGLHADDEVFLGGMRKVME